MPARLRDIKRALEARGITVETPPSGGSHYRARKDSIVYPIPSHGGLKGEINDIYIRGLCRRFGLDEDAFRRDL